MIALFEQAQEQQMAELKIQAGFQGIKLGPSSGTPADSPMMFGDPKSYEHLSQEEREKLTRKMMGMHKQAMAKTPIGRRG